MATIGTTKTGQRYVQFFNNAGQRKTIRLDKAPKRDQEAVRFHVAALVHAKAIGGTPPARTTAWLAEIGDDLAAKIANTGLIEPRTEIAVAHLGPFIDEYHAIREVKASTKKAWLPAFKSLRQFFGDHMPLAAITKGHAKRWREHIEAGGLAPNTVRKRTAIAKTLFTAAVDFDLIQANPFAGLQSTITANHSRDYFVTAEESARILEECPDVGWRTIFALCRWGGLRCPTEVLALRWCDVLWDKNRFGPCFCVTLS